MIETHIGCPRIEVFLIEALPDLIGDPLQPTAGFEAVVKQRRHPFAPGRVDKKAPLFRAAAPASVGWAGKGWRTALSKPGRESSQASLL